VCNQDGRTESIQNQVYTIHLSYYTVPLIKLIFCQGGLLGPLLSLMKGESDITSLLSHLPELISTQILKVTFFSLNVSTYYIKIFSLFTFLPQNLFSRPYLQLLLFSYCREAQSTEVFSFSPILYVCKMFHKYVIKTPYSNNTSRLSSRTNHFESNCRLTHSTSTCLNKTLFLTCVFNIHLDLSKIYIRSDY
jgi:hypothetical protein